MEEAWFNLISGAAIEVMMHTVIIQAQMFFSENFH